MWIGRWRKSPQSLPTVSIWAHIFDWMWCEAIYWIVWLIFSILLPQSLISLLINSRPTSQSEDGERDEWTSENTVHHPFHVMIVGWSSRKNCCWFRLLTLDHLQKRYRQAYRSFDSACSSWNSLQNMFQRCSLRLDRKMKCHILSAAGDWLHFLTVDSNPLMNDRGSFLFVIRYYCLASHIH